jgi:uncharacterized protein YkwD
VTLLGSVRKRRAGASLALLAVGALTFASTDVARAGAPSTTTAATDAQSVFQLLNRERAAHGLAALHWRARLVRAAHAHNLRMATYNTLSHQLPGEHSLGYRVTATGYQWRAVGENIGYTENWLLAGIVAVQLAMYNEVAPYDVHRRNILSTTYRDIGIDIVMDSAHHKAWITEVFARALT